MKLRAGLVLLVGVLIAADAREDATEKKTATKVETTTKEDVKNIQGTWIIVAFETDGESASKEGIQYTRFIFKGEKLIFGAGKVAIEGTFKLDAMKKPKTIDITVSNGGDVKRVLGIYRLQGDEFIICGRGNDKQRPKEFKTAKGSGTAMLTLKREK